jgi:chorismate mutase/prephenate dehydratase
MEKPLKVAFLGPKATFTHIACVQKFGLSGADLISHKSIQDIFDEVERGRIDYGVVPVENSTEGIVSHTLDMFMEYEVKIAGEILLEISHALLSKDGKIGNIKKIYSNPYAIAQCRNWLRNNLPDIPIHEVETTALAAQTAADNIGIAAIASESAAMLYNLQVIHKKIEDNINNYTRFLILSKKIPERSGYDKTSILFSVKDEVGILYKMLEPFAKNGINLTKIESRPMKKKPWEYVFFVDMEGHIEDDKVGGAIKELEKKSVFIKHLGSYPRCKDIN